MARQSRFHGSCWIDRGQALRLAAQLFDAMNLDEWLAHCERLHP